jgi:hypothetical protein
MTQLVPLTPSPPPPPPPHTQVPFTSVAAAADERFHYFANTLLPQALQAQRAGLLVYIPSYFDYVRVRAHLKVFTTWGLFASLTAYLSFRSLPLPFLRLQTLGVNFCHVCEYTKRSDVARDRADFAKVIGSLLSCSLSSPLSSPSFFYVCQYDIFSLLSLFLLSLGFPPPPPTTLSLRTYVLATRVLPTSCSTRSVCTSTTAA